VSGLELGAIMFVVMLALIMARMPVGVAMLFVGGVGYVMLSGWDPLINFLKTSTYGRVASYTLSVIPLFLLMGQFATKAGLNTALFRAARAWFGHQRGGIAIAAIGGCAAFGAICGSSTATAATMAHVSLPELRRYNYSNTLATGTLAAGGTLGILIPPSIILVIYAVIAEQSILDMFVAAFIPGIIATVGYMAVVAIVVRVDESAGPAAERMPWLERIKCLKEIWSTAAVFILVMGGIYLGWFSPTEGAAIGAAAVGVLAYVVGGMRWAGFLECLLGTAKATAMIFLILIGAEIYNSFLALTQLPVELADMIAESGLPPLAIVAIMLVIYLVLGCVMDALAMILLTIPVFIPIVIGLDFGLDEDAVLVWFGVLAVVAVEMGLITPPIGINIFVINSMAEDVPLADSFKGVLPFVASDIVRVAIILLFPATALWLPNLL